MAFLYSQDALGITQRLGQQFDCGTDSSSLVNCLRDKPYPEIFSAIERMDVAAKAKSQSPDFDPTTITAFFPTVDGEFFPEHPMFTKYFNPGNMVVGYNSDEIGFLMRDMLGLASPLTVDELSTKLGFVAHMLAQGNKGYVSQFLDKLKEVYRGSPDTHTNRKTAQRAMGDSWFVANAYAKASKHGDSGNKVICMNCCTA
jgi:hypothetical protein